MRSSSPSGPHVNDPLPPHYHPTSHRSRRSWHDFLLLPRRSIAEDLRQWDTASELLAKVHASLKPPHSDDPALLLRLGSALRQKGDFPGSIEAYEKALKLVRSGRAASSSSSAAAPGAPPGPPVTINRIKVLMAEPLYLIGARDPAVSLIMTVRKSPQAAPRPRHHTAPKALRLIAQGRWHRPCV